jgi:hypothetical protein
MTKNLIFLAGKNAYNSIKINGLNPNKVTVIAGAAGGPKWLVLNRLDRLLFTEFFKNRTEPLYLIGSSIGAWRFATICQSDPIAARQKFEFAYINQRYETKPSPSEVTAESRRIMDSFLGEAGIRDILKHPVFKISFMAVRCKWPASEDTKGKLTLGLLAALGFNLIRRPWLKWQFERTLFHLPQINLPYLISSEFPINRVKLTPENFKEALLASGSIPLVMEGIRQIPEAPAGTYRDGGLIDYHMDLPYQTSEDELVLFPHFTEKIVPGWLDKTLKWRKPNSDHMKNVVLVAPTRDFISRLPNRKIPDRNDFKLYRGRDDDRIRDWYQVVDQGEKLASEFAETVLSGKIRQVIKPLT